MSEKKEEGYHALTALATGGTFAALLYSILKGRPGSPGETPEGIVHLDEEVMLILAGIAATEQSILESMVTVPGFPPNCETFTAFQVPMGAIGVPLRLPNFPIPDGFQLVVKNHPANNVGTIVYVGKTMPDAQNINTAWPLLINESIGLAIKNSESIWVACNTANMAVSCIVEQRS